MSHALIIGMTESGKTTLAKMIAIMAKKRGVFVAVLDPLKDPGFSADFQTADPSHFLTEVKRRKSGVLIIDEAGQVVGRYNPAMEWVVTTSRHLGHSSVIICQGAGQVSPLVRGQCTTCYLFASNVQTIKQMAEDFNAPELLKFPRLKRGEFYLISRYESPRKMVLDVRTRQIKEAKLEKRLDGGEGDVSLKDRSSREGRASEPAEEVQNQDE